MSAELVLLHHNEPMTTSLAIAEGTENSHKSVIQLVRKYVEDLQEFGSLAFEMRVMRQDGRGGEQGEVAFLNEQQATLLITYLRNTDTVRRFKIALVKAFYEMRDRLRAAAPQFTTRQLDHGADLAVAADRTFRSFLRAARSSGLRLPQALAVANRQTVARTGMDMLAEIGIDPVDAGGQDLAADPLAAQLVEWIGKHAPGPWRVVDIVGDLLGLPPDDPEFRRASVRVANLLRAQGYAPRRRRYNGAAPYRWWSR